MNFSEALTELKAGLAVARRGWNGRGMFVYLVQANAYPATSQVAKDWFGDDCPVPYRAYLAMKTVDNDVVPWVASQTDILASDWELA